MCTAISFGKYAGRNLDIEKGYGESVIITPRAYTLAFRRAENITDHYAFIGIGTVSRGYPLYYDAANEHGLYAAALNYVGNARYLPKAEKKINLPPYEVIPYILSTCKCVDDAKERLENINLIDIPFSSDLPVADLHFFIADTKKSLTAEPDRDGLSVYDNQVGVLTNNPPFPMQMHNLSKYSGLSKEPIINRLSRDLQFNQYSKGMGALGLPGDLSSESRFVRAAFHRLNCQNSGTPCDIFHLLGSVEMPDGSVKLGDLYERTEYSSAVNLETLTYYYRTYKSLSLTAASLLAEDLSGRMLISYPVIDETRVYRLN